jgi:chromosome segregation ATPase
MARTTKAALEAQVADLKLLVQDLQHEISLMRHERAELRDRVSELEGELEAHRAPAPAPTRTVGEVLRLALSSKAAAQAAAKDAAMQHKRCTRVIQLPTGEFTWEYYGKKAA